MLLAYSPCLPTTIYVDYHVVTSTHSPQLHKSVMPRIQFTDLAQCHDLFLRGSIKVEF
jgi:hypothetical protein